MHRARKDRGTQVAKHMVMMVFAFVFVLCMQSRTVPGRTSAQAIDATHAGAGSGRTRQINVRKLMIVIVCVVEFVLCKHAYTMPGRTSAHVKEHAFTQRRDDECVGVAGLRESVKREYSGRKRSKREMV